MKKNNTRFWGARAIVPALALVLSACAGARIDAGTQAYVDGLNDNGGVLSQYLVGPEDMLEVKVWGDESLSTMVSVRPDGKITLPLVGDLAASGRSSVDIGADYQERLKAYKSAPQVEVSIAQINSYRLYVLGEVNKPGMVQVRNMTSLLQVLALAGGPSRFASNEIVVLRKEADNTERVLRVDYRMLASADTEFRGFNMTLLPGDTIVVK